MRDTWEQVKDMTEELRSARLASVFAGRFWNINEVKLGLSEMKEAAERRRKLGAVNAAERRRKLGVMKEAAERRRKLAEEHIYKLKAAERTRTLNEMEQEHSRMMETLKLKEQEEKEREAKAEQAAGREGFTDYKGSTPQSGRQAES
jgi:hypothetical protein